MLTFDPNDPFPLIPLESHTYAEAQAHSEKVDEWLGFETKAVEEKILSRESSSQVLWLGLPVQALQTPYTEIRAILQELGPRPGQTIVDLGAGYGRMGLVIARHYPKVNFFGYEFVGERVRESLRILSTTNPSHPLIHVLEADLGDPSFSPVPADFYFLYDFGARWAIEKALQDLRKIARDRAIVVVGRGRSSRDAIERHHPWLSQVVEPRHFPHFSIYRSGETD